MFRYYETQEVCFFFFSYRNSTSKALYICATWHVEDERVSEIQQVNDKALKSLRKSNARNLVFFSGRHSDKPSV